MVNTLLRLRHGELDIDFSEKNKGIEKIKFDVFGNLQEINSRYGKWKLTRSPIPHIYTDIPNDNVEELIRLSYEVAEVYMKKSTKNDDEDSVKIKEALEIICGVGYEGYKKRENFEGWNKFIPPLEHQSLVLYNEVMTGCPKSQNPCIFCNVYRNQEFGIVPLEEFSRRERLLAEYAPTAREDRKKGEARVLSFVPEELLDYMMGVIHKHPKFFWGSGNIFALKPEDLLKRLEEHNKYFNFSSPDMELGDGTISAFGHSKYILNHLDFLKEYRALGLKEVWVGVESGDDVSLKLMNKSATAKDHIRAGKALRNAGITCNVTVLYSGIEAKRLDRHISATRKCISKMKPSCVYFSDLVVHEGTRLDELVKQQKIVLSGEKTPKDLGFANIGGVSVWNYGIPV